MNRRDEIEAERRREAEAVLAGVTRDGEVVGTSGAARVLRETAEKVGGHFTGQDAASDDAVEIWGKRIGRGLALVVAVGLVVHLLTTYVLR